jgi:hypothetical protein
LLTALLLLLPVEAVPKIVIPAMARRPGEVLEVPLAPISPAPVTIHGGEAEGSVAGGWISLGGQLLGSPSKAV